MEKYITMDKTFNLLIKPWVIIICLTAIFFSYFNIDRPLALYFHQLDLRANMHFLTAFTSLGKWIIYVAFFLMSALYFHFVSKNQKYEKNSWYLFACILIPNILGFILKIALSRSRPALLFSDNLYGFYWFKLDDHYWSMPSGHAITIAALAAGVGSLLPRLYSFFLFLALLVACSRVMLYHHYLSDVLVGFYLSILLVGLFSSYINPKKEVASSKSYNKKM